MATVERVEVNGNEMLQDSLTSWHYATSGAITGTCTALITQPFDTVKTRLQVQGIQSGSGSTAGKYSGSTLHILKNIVTTEGFRGLYKGLPPALLSMPVSIGLFFPIYQKCREKWSAMLNRPETHPLVICPSVLSGWLVASVIVSPVSLVKVRLQTLQSKCGMFRTFANIIRNEGFLTLYQGYKGHMLASFFFGLYFSMYEPMKTILSKQTGWDVVAVSPIANLASLSIACLPTYPNDVILSRMRFQTKQNQHYEGYLHAVRSIVNQEGLKGLYAGFGTYLLRVSVASLASVSIYEFCIYSWRQSLQTK